MKILVIDGHPNNESLCSTLAEKYVQGANAGGHEVDLLKIRDLDFNPNLQYGYAKPMDLEQDLIKVQDLIRECDHIVLVLPYWWSGLPALFKGFVDRVLLPGFAFQFTENGKLKPLLKDKTARVIYTQGSPAFFTTLFLRDAFWTSLKIGILGFCGFSPVKRTYLDNISKASKARIGNFLEDVYKLGKLAK
ncbi:MAG: NAD(P)H-dependent oxidoreductase [bacterium]